MYWYVKYPLIAILALGLLCIVGLCWRSCSRTRAPEKNATLEEPAVTPPVEEAQKTDDSSLSTTKGIAVPAPLPVVGVEDRLAAARKQLELGKLDAARQIARQILKMEGVKEFDPVWTLAIQIVDDVNARLMNSSAPAPEKKFYRVVKGDTLEGIANRHYTSVGALIRCNESLQRDDSRDPIIRPSQTLCYIQGTWSIRVSKQQFLLMLYLNGEIYRVWSVGIGRENRTPAGTFLIAGKLTDPAWTPPGKFIPAGDPENVLGTRWLKLTPVEGTDPSLEGYGIHGTTQPDTVGTSCSAGCVRLRNAEVEELYDFIPTPGGSAPPVKVRIEE